MALELEKIHCRLGVRYDEENNQRRARSELRSVPFRATVFFPSS
jgi:hypothetical protein